MCVCERVYEACKCSRLSMCIGGIKSVCVHVCLMRTCVHDSMCVGVLLGGYD